MLIICPSCVSSYRINPDKLGILPRAARCAHCRKTFAISPAEPSRPPQADLPFARSDRAPALTARRPETIGLVVPRTIRANHPLHGASAVVPPAERSSVRIVAAAVLLVGVAMAGVAEQERLRQAIPSVEPVMTALGLGREPGLTLQDVKTAVADEGPNKVLTLEGRIANTQVHRAAIPDLQIIVRDDTAQSLYTWTTPAPQASLAPGEAVAFRSRLVSPPADAHDLAVSFEDTTGSVRVKGRK